MNNLSRARAASERSSIRSRGARTGTSEQPQPGNADDATPSKFAIEISDAIRAHITRCSERATEQAELLETIGEQSFEMVGEIHGGLSDDALRYHAHRMRGLVVHTLGVVAELQRVVGQLDALASMRAAERANDERDET
ncbi:MAG: hypothetical protein KF795_00505 [Labilithrix sp.]|nr:hypothetical protein [Labilithrix sp.]